MSEKYVDLMPGVHGFIKIKQYRSATVSNVLQYNKRVGNDTPTGRTTEGATLAMPESVVANDISTNGFKLIVAGANKLFEVSENGKIIALTSANEITITGKQPDSISVLSVVIVRPNGAYSEKFDIAIKTKLGNATPSNPVNPLPSPTTNLAVSETGFSSLRVTWSPPSPIGGTVAFQVLCNGISCYYGNSFSIDISNVPTNTEQFIQVRTVSAAGYFSVPQSVRKTIARSQSAKIKTNLDSVVLIDTPSFDISWIDTIPSQWETVIFAWQRNKQDPIINQKVLRGTNSFTVDGFEDGIPLNIIITNIPELDTGGEPDYVNEQRSGVQTFSIPVRL